jgi:hypothetical protein
LTVAKRNRAPIFADIASKVESIDQQISELKGKKLDHKIGDLDENLDHHFAHEYKNASSSALGPYKNRKSSSSIIELILPESLREHEIAEHPKK